MFGDFRIARYEMILEAGPKGLMLPAYKGSTLRGGFGTVFRKICCSRPSQQCNTCLVKQTCPYASIFEPSPPEGSTVLKNYSDIPRPFVIEPPLETKLEYKPGEKIAFGLVLVGQAITFLPYFILSFKELGNIGLGKGRLPFTLAEVKAYLFEDDKFTTVYQAGANRIVPVSCEITLENLQQLPVIARSLNNEAICPQLLALSLLTPTRLKFDQTLVTALPFHVLIRNLLRRISTLYYFHHGKEPGSENVDYKALIAAATEVQTVSTNLRLQDWERYSQRQDARMNMGGLVGEAKYRGDIEQFWPLLLLGEVIHVGKGCVFGLGKYEIKRKALG